jgi:hypothetical protein
MKTIPILLATLALAFLNACSTAAVEKPPARAEAASQRWSGDYPVAELQRLPAGQQQSRVGYLASPQAFGAVWAAFKPWEATPAVDFDKNLVVFVRNVDFYNRTNILRTELKDGVLEVLAMETMSAIPIGDKAAMAMVVVPRQGVKAIQSGPVRIALPAE